MNEIICPHCKKIFKVDEAGFADIVKQVRDHRFEEELQQRLNLAENEKVNAILLAEANLKNLFQENLAKKDNEIIPMDDRYNKRIIGNCKNDSNCQFKYYGNCWDKYKDKETLKGEILTEARRELELTKKLAELKEELE